MQWLPELGLSWLNGWLLLATFYMVFGILMLVFPRGVVARLYSITGWSRRQRCLSALGKVFSLSCLAIIIFAPLQLGTAVCFLGLTIFAAGFTTMIIALFDYRRTPAGRPVTRGLYRFTRNPQWLSLAAGVPRLPVDPSTTSAFSARNAPASPAMAANTRTTCDAFLAT